MFDVVFWNDLQRSNRVYEARRLASLSAAREARKLSGDLVVYADSDNVVQSDAWLWDWERKAREKSYAWRHAARVEHDLVVAKRREKWLRMTSNLGGNDDGT